MRTKKPWLTLMALLACLSLVAAACGDDEDDASTDTTEQAGDGATTTTADDMGSDPTTGDEPMGEDMVEPVGEACGEIPTDGPGSSAGMAADPTATAASNNPLLSTLVAAVGVADLGDALNDPSAEYTVFAPINSAFEALPEGTVESLTTDPAQLETLTTILTQHVVEGSMDIDELIAAGEVTALNGETNTIEESGETFMINGEAMVVCGNVTTANATVHLIDTVLMPPTA